MYRRSGLPVLEQPARLVLSPSRKLDLGFRLVLVQLRVLGSVFPVSIDIKDQSQCHLLRNQECPSLCNSWCSTPRHPVTTDKAWLLSPMGAFALLATLQAPGTEPKPSTPEARNPGSIKGRNDNANLARRWDRARRAAE